MTDIQTDRTAQADLRASAAVPTAPAVVREEPGGPMMRAIVLEKFGGLDSLVYTEIPKPRPKDGEVVIAVKGFGINHAEIHMRRGEWAEAAEVSGIECVGLVDSCPGGEFPVGAKVAALMGGLGRTINGSYAQYTRVRASNVARIDADLPWMDAFYEEDERVVGHAADAYHRIDIRATSRHLVVRQGDRVIADTHRPLALYESGFAPRWYVPRDDVNESALEPVDGQTFCPYKGLASYYTIGDRERAAWSYINARPEVGRVRNLVSFEPDKIDVFIDGKQVQLEPGQNVVPHGVDRGLDPEEILRNTPAWEHAMKAQFEVVTLHLSGDTIVTWNDSGLAA